MLIFEYLYLSIYIIVYIVILSMLRRPSRAKDPGFYSLLFVNFKKHWNFHFLCNSVFKTEKPR